MEAGKGVVGWRSDDAGKAGQVAQHVDAPLPILHVSAINRRSATSFPPPRVAAPPVVRGSARPATHRSHRPHRRAADRPAGLVDLPSQMRRDRATPPETTQAGDPGTGWPTTPKYKPHTPRGSVA